MSYQTAPEMLSSPADTVATPRMQAHVVGQGAPLALVGGGLTGWRSWEPHAGRLAGSRTVARLQPLNVQYGLENRPMPRGYSVKMESAALAAALDELGWDEPLDLVAWSYGGLIALDFALDHPRRIRTLTLVEPAAPWVLPGKGLGDPEIQSEKSLEDSFGLSMTGDDVTEERFKRFLHASGLAPHDVDPETLPQWPVWFEHRRSLRGVSTFGHDDRPERLRAFDRPVLLVLGTGTVPFQSRVHEALLSALPRARGIEMPAGHAPQIVSMDRFLEELERFHDGAGVTGSIGAPSGSDVPSEIHHVVSRDGTRIGYERRGAGPPLLFVHGTTADRRSWMRLAPHLERHVSVVAMDRRGRGESGDAPAYDLMREAEDVGAVAEALGGPVTVVGHSFGGLVALEAERLTDRIGALILYEPVLPSDDAVPPDVRGRIADLVDRDELEAAMELMLREVGQLSDEEMAVYRASPLWASRIPLARTIPREMDVETSADFHPERYSDLRVPTVLLLGEHSPEAYRRHVETLHASLPESRIVIIPGQQHVAHLTAPEQLAGILLEVQ